ncbi:uncharacterized protein LOC123669180 [Melitaea cinxia]|uniref:uncharacterized protein LOC123669180 n=1 Tax=Melitaea cinxia TaxID=113334 RepID=UPI001E2713FA|nr:uncharacterized protein LOC123669180 [Melitaea cinxia]
MRSKHATPKKPQQILFSKNTYGPKVKVQNWDYQRHVEKKDNNVYHDHLSNHLSTYLRWGDQDQNIGKSETHSMLEEIYQKTDPIYAFKPLVNFTSYPCTDTPGRNKLMKNANLAQLPLDFGVMDYLTTQQDEYRNPYATVATPLTLASPPYLLNRVIRSDLTHNHGTAPPKGEYQCLDTHTPIGHIRQMRWSRYQSFNPATCVQDFPSADLFVDQK